MPTTLIIGYGNLLRSDDGVGPRAAAALQSELQSPEFSILAAHQLTPEMAEPVAQSARVVFLDAAHAGTPGEIRCQKVSRDPQFDPGNLSHHLTPSGLLELAARFFHAEAEAWLLTITGENFDLGESFSPSVEASWPDYLARVKSLVTPR